MLRYKGWGGKFSVGPGWQKPTLDCVLFCQRWNFNIIRVTLMTKITWTSLKIRRHFTQSQFKLV